MIVTLKFNLCIKYQLNAFMKTSEKGLYLIKHSEGIIFEAYLCPAGVWTIGYGHTRNVKQGDTVTLDQAEILLQEDVRPCENELNELDINFTQNQFDALVSFNFNLGTTAFKVSTLLKKTKADPLDPTIKDEFMKWCKSGGKELRGLKLRREREAALYFA